MNSFVKPTKEMCGYQVIFSRVLTQKISKNIVGQWGVKVGSYKDFTFILP